MGGIAPPYMVTVARDIAAKGGGSFSGIVSGSGWGYHNSVNTLSSSNDYSNVLSNDRNHNPAYSSAMDISLPPASMKTMTARLMNAAKADDPRLFGIREFCGTLNGSQVAGYDLANNRQFNNWDSSHLWHIHVSFYRRYCLNNSAIDGVRAVMLGTGGGVVTPPPATGDATGSQVWTHQVPKTATVGDPRTTAPAQDMLHGLNVASWQLVDILEEVNSAN